MKRRGHKMAGFIFICEEFLFWGRRTQWECAWCGQCYLSPKDQPDACWVPRARNCPNAEGKR